MRLKERPAGQADEEMGLVGDSDSWSKDIELGESIDGTEQNHLLASHAHPPARSEVRYDDDFGQGTGRGGAGGASSSDAGSSVIGAASAGAPLEGVGGGSSARGRELQLKPLEIEAGTGARRLKAGRPKKRLYSVWPSRNKFFCKGILMTGGETEFGVTPNCSVPNLCVWTCILAPCSLYFLWVFPHLWSQGCYAMPVATLMLFLLTTGFLLATCCSDPGIIPRREVVLATGCQAKLERALGYDVLAMEDGKGGGRASISPELSRRGYRLCRTCRIIRPPRASHCPDCDNCVLRYDHHCPFVNNCVGQRNYHFFFGFVTSVMCLAVLVLPVLFWFLNSDNFEAAVGALTNIGSGALQPLFFGLIIVGAIIGIAALLSFILWLYHLFLILTARTTKEFRRKIPNVAEEPTLCAARGPRLFDPWAMVDPVELVRPDEPPPSPPGNVCSGCWSDD